MARSSKNGIARSGQVQGFLRLDSRGCLQRRRRDAPRRAARQEQVLRLLLQAGHRRPRGRRDRRAGNDRDDLGVLREPDGYLSERRPPRSGLTPFVGPVVRRVLGSGRLLARARLTGWREARRQACGTALSSGARRGRSNRPGPPALTDRSRVRPGDFLGRFQSLSRWRSKCAISLPKR